MTQLPLLFGQPHRNQQLFSDYYLNHLLPQRADWKLLVADARAALAQIVEIFAAHIPSTNEAQTEDGLIKPVLAMLGHTFEIQAPLATPDGTKKPDYVLYRDASALVANKGRVLTEMLLRGNAIAVGDAKYWERPLDTALKASADPFTNKNPSYQIAFYLQHSGLDWGILTNGRVWRLYHKDTAHKLDRYYEVDLPALLQRDDPAAFLYFYAFFHRSAFEPQPLGLAELLRESANYARGVSATLKTQVFGALRHLAQGFLDYPRNHLQPDPVTLRTIYDHSLIVLYRLLFILYAEARDLLSGRKTGSYKWYELQDSIDYWQLFERPKLLYQEIQFHPWYCFDNKNYFSNNKVFLLQKADNYLLAVLNSPLMWWHNWRYLLHMKDEALSPVAVLMEKLHIAPPTDDIRAQVEPAVERLITITQENQAARRDLLDWLRTEFDVESPGQKLAEFATLDIDTFIEEVRKRRPKTASRLTPAALRDLRNAYTEQATPVQQRGQEAATLERRLADLVNLAYGLPTEESDLLWRTAPPRMPPGRPVLLPAHDD